MFTIGLIEDEEKQIKKIRRTIKSIAERYLADRKFDFKNYSLDGLAENLINNVSTEVIDDIKNGVISTLIIDYKIMIKAIKIEGTDIFDSIHKVIPEFPLVILTDRPEDSIKPDFIDPDKVYKKSEFFKLEEDYSIEKVKNIFRNMERYEGIREKLERELLITQEKVKEVGVEQQVFEDLINIEATLDQYLPMNNTYIEKVFDTDKIKEVVNLLEKANDLLE